MTKQDFAWRVGGPQGRGVDTAAGIFARACAAGGLHVFGRREYYSNIMGRHSYFDVRVASAPLSCHREHVDLLVTFEAETLIRHAVSVLPGGAIIYDTGDEDVPLDRIVYLDPPAKQALTAYLQERDLPISTAGLLEDAKQRGVAIFPLPFIDLSSQLRSELGISQTAADRMQNTMAVAASSALVQWDRKFLRQALVKVFSERSRLVDLNMHAIDMVYEYVANNFDTAQFIIRLQPVSSSEQRLLVNGNQAVAMGKLAAGIGVQTYYPISPATDESVYLEAHETFPQRNGGNGSVLVVQTEDEIAAVTMATGAALTGARAATATSGPGFSLMAEGLGWAGINEVPIVVTVYQRGGPSTGLPTRTEQGDLQFALHPGHGEFPHFVLASGDAVEAFYDAAAAFNYAERYQTAVVHLLDKELGSSTRTVPYFDVDSIQIDRGLIFDPEKDAIADHEESFRRFPSTETGISVRPLLGQPGGTHWLTGGEHTEYGRVTEDPTVRELQMEKRARKLQLAAEQIPVEEKFRVYGEANAALTIIGWGSTKGASIEALERLEAEGIAARLIQVRLLRPFPAKELMPLLKTSAPLIAVECNQSGQFAALLREQTGRQCDHLVLKYNGRSISGVELHRALKDIYEGRKSGTVVLRNPLE